jgi:hypothetical protein
VVLKDDGVGVVDEEEGRSANKRDFVECPKSFACASRKQAIRFNQDCQ